MALQKAITLDNGYEANYWVVSNVEIYKNTNTQISVLLYLNEQTKQDGKRNVYAKGYSVSGEAWDTYFANTVLDTANPFKSAYDYLKTLDEFQGAIDV